MRIRLTLARLFGQSSTTDDADGEITAVADVSKLTETEVLSALMTFQVATVRRPCIRR